MQPRPSWSKTPAIYMLIAVNVAVYLTIHYVLAAPALAATCFGGLHIYSVLANGELWRIISSIFVHYEIQHLGFNLVALLIFGSYAEQSFGRPLTFFIYFFCGIAANLIAIVLGLVQGTAFTYCAIGASGAILGLAAGTGYYMWRQWRENRNPAALAFARQLAIILLIQFTLDLLIPQTSFTHHLGGALAGIVLVFLLLKFRVLRTGYY